MDFRRRKSRMGESFGVLTNWDNPNKPTHNSQCSNIKLNKEAKLFDELDDKQTQHASLRLNVIKEPAAIIDIKTQNIAYHAT